MQLTSELFGGRIEREIGTWGDGKPGTDAPRPSLSTERVVALARATPGHLVVQWSAQNIGHTVTLYRTAKRMGRTLVVDLYGAEVLERIADGTGIPRPGALFSLLKVLITPGGQRMYHW